MNNPILPVASLVLALSVYVLIWLVPGLDVLHRVLATVFFAYFNVTATQIRSDI